MHSMKNSPPGQDELRDVGEERFQLIARAGNDVIWDWNIETGACWQSKTIRHLGYSESTSPGERLCLDHAHPDHLDRVLRGIDEVLAGDGNYWSDEYPFLRKDGDVVDVLNRACVVRNGAGRAIRMVGAMIDMTGRKQARERAQARGTEKTKLETEFSRRRSSKSGGATKRRAVLQPNEFIQEFVKIIDEYFPKSIQVKTSCDPVLREIEGDDMELNQVLVNLCINARDAMPNGGTMTLSSQNVTLKEPVSCAGLYGPPGEYVQIQVADTGDGMSEELQKRIFQPYFTTKDPGENSGLGLATIVRILQNHRGLLNFESAPGKGTTFSVCFPAKIARPTPEAAPAVPAQTMNNQKLVLLVDDEAEICEMCQTILEAFDYRVLTALNGMDALAHLERHKDEVSAALVDMKMPVMDGAATIRAMRASVPQLKIIAASGLSENEQSAALDGAAPNAFLHKPYSADQLLAALAKLLP
jgi:PAS domain S-box-containing protein